MRFEGFVVVPVEVFFSAEKSNRQLSNKLVRGGELDKYTYVDNNYVRNVDDKVAGNDEAHQSTWWFKCDLENLDHYVMERSELDVGSSLWWVGWSVA